MLKIYHNTRCSKSREACSIITETGEKMHIVDYLKSPLKEDEMKDLLSKLGMKAEQIIRKKEPLFKEKFADKKRTEAQWIKILCAHPILMERPILVKGNKAVVGRPIENIYKLL